MRRIYCLGHGTSIQKSIQGSRLRVNNSLHRTTMNILLLRLTALTELPRALWSTLAGLGKAGLGSLGWAGLPRATTWRYI